MRPVRKHYRHPCPYQGERRFDLLSRISARVHALPPPHLTASLVAILGLVAALAATARGEEWKGV